MTAFDVHRPTEGDVLDLILADHYLMEHLLRQMRSLTGDREAARQAFAAVHVAHAEAEERFVYPVIKRKAAEVSAHDAEHGKEEHAQATDALLKVMELKGVDTQAYEDAVKDLSALACHHLAEEELTILTPAREEVSLQVRADLGATFAAERNRQIDDNCGSLTNLRRLVKAADRKGLLDDEKDEIKEAKGEK